MSLLDIDGRAVARYLPVDLLAIFVFVFLGELQHTTLSAQRYAGVLLPFLIGWLVVAPIVGAYGKPTVDSTRGAVGFAVAGWLGADFLGQMIRETSLFPGNASPQFFLVAFVFGGLLVVAMRFVTLVVVDFNRN